MPSNPFFMDDNIRKYAKMKKKDIQKYAKTDKTDILKYASLKIMV